jgi:hypothetical protein
MSKVIKTLVVANSEQSPWVPFAVQSLRENLVGAGEIVVVSDGLGDGADDALGCCVKADEAWGDIERPFLTRSHTILNADKFVGECDFVVVTMPNFIVCEPFDVNNWIEDGKPTILCDTYSSLAKQGGGLGASVQNWKASTEAVLDCQVQYEFARLLPIMYPITALREIRGFLLNQLEADDLVDYLNKVENKYLPEYFCFNEMNAIGGYLHSKDPDSVNWVVMSQASRLSKYLPSVTCDFSSTIDDKDVRDILKEQSNKRTLSAKVRKYLKKLSKFGLTEEVESV